LKEGVGRDDLWFNDLLGDNGCQFCLAAVFQFAVALERLNTIDG